MNLDPQTLTHFNQMAADWWDPCGSCKPLHLLNPVRLQYILQHTPLRGQTVLDIGCGGGILSESMAQQGAIVTGLELAGDVIIEARRHAQTQNLSIHYIQETAEAFAQTHAGTFDVITCMELLEHVPDPLSLLQAATTLLKPNGRFFFSTLNRTPMAFIQAILGAEYLLKMLPKGTHHYRQFIQPSELDAWLSEFGFKIKHLQGLGYRPVREQFYLSDSVKVNYIGVAIPTIREPIPE